MLHLSPVLGQEELSFLKEHGILKSLKEARDRFHEKSKNVEDAGKPSLYEAY